MNKRNLIKTIIIILVILINIILLSMVVISVSKTIKHLLTNSSKISTSNTTQEQKEDSTPTNSEKNSNIFKNYKHKIFYTLQKAVSYKNYKPNLNDVLRIFLLITGTILLILEIKMLLKIKSQL